MPARLLARLGPVMAGVLLRFHQVRLSAGLVACTGCGDFATTLGDLCDTCDNDLLADCEARNEENDMPRSSTTHTLFHPELRNIGTATNPRLELLVSASRWSLSGGDRSRWSWLDGCSTSWATDRSGARVYPVSWHPSKVKAVQAYREQQQAHALGFLQHANEAQARRQLADDWLDANKRASTITEQVMDQEDA